MAKYLTTNTLINSVKLRAAIPSNQNTFTENDFLEFANEELDLGIIPHVLSFHEEYFVYTEIVPLKAGVQNYPVPERAVGSKLRELSYVDSSDNIFEMTRINSDDVSSYQSRSIGNHTVFYVEGSDIVIVPTINNTSLGSLRFSYYLRPNEMVSEDRVAIITNINRTTGEIAVASVPKNITVAATLDLIQTKSPHKSMAINVVPSALNTVTKTFTFAVADIPARLAVGDQLALAGETIVPQVPSDLHSMLAQRVAARCLESLGDTQGITLANTKLAEMEQKTGTLLQNRVEGATRKVINKHGSLMRKASRRWF